MALMEIFQSPSNTVLYGSIFDETILILMNTPGDLSLKSIGSHLSEHFNTHTSQGDGPKITDGLRACFLWDQSNERAIQSLQFSSTIKEFISELVKVLTHNGPTFLKEHAIKTIRARCLINGHMLDSVINFLFIKRFSETVKIRYFR